MGRLPAIGIALGLAMAIVGCSSGPEPTLPSAPANAAAIAVEAPTFTNGLLIHPRFTCDGVNLSPQVSWSGVPTGTASIAVVLNDPDAPGGSYIHWLVYDLPPTVTSFQEGDGKPFQTLPEGGTQGKNSSGDLGYTGPCPPKGETHTYELHVYALDKELGLPPTAPRSQVLQAIDGSVIGHGVLTASYKRITITDPNIVFGLTPTP